VEQDMNRNKDKEINRSGAGYEQDQG